MGLLPVIVDSLLEGNTGSLGEPSRQFFEKGKAGWRIHRRTGSHEDHQVSFAMGGDEITGEDDVLGEVHLIHVIH